MKVAFVIPRYAVEAAGGAEMVAQGFAEHLPEVGVETEVLTTCASDHFGWENHFPPGAVELGGVTVRRFEVNRDRDIHTFAQIQQRIEAGMEVSLEDQRHWTKESVNSRSMCEYIASHKDDYDFFIFMPYLFGTTFWGSAAAPEKALLLPTLHDEVYSHLPVFRELFGRVRGVLFLSEPEMALAARLFGLPGEKSMLVGFGFPSEIIADAESFRKKYGLREPFILYVGRREKGKNTPMLVRYFEMYWKRNPGMAKLVFIGTGDLAIPAGVEEGVLDLGYVPRQVKYDAHAAAALLCQPSVNESLSIVLMESWLTGVPALVNADCAVTRYHCVKSGGGLYFKDYLEFEECAKLLLEQPGLRSRMGEAGRRYVRGVYSWPQVMQRFRKALERFGA